MASRTVEVVTSLTNGEQKGRLIGQKHEPKYYQYFQKYRCYNGYQAAVNKRLSNLKVVLRTGSTIKDLKTKFEVKRYRAINRLDKKFLNAIKRRQYEVKLLGTELTLEILQKLKPLEKFGNKVLLDYYSEMRRGISLAFGIACKK